MQTNFLMIQSYVNEFLLIQLINANQLFNNVIYANEFLWYNKLICIIIISSICAMGIHLSIISFPSFCHFPSPSETRFDGIDHLRWHNRAVDFQIPVSGTHDFAWFYKGFWEGRWEVSRGGMCFPPCDSILFS